jgi:hypothetical protein
MLAPLSFSSEFRLLGAWSGINSQHRRRRCKCGRHVCDWQWQSPPCQVRVLMAARPAKLGSRRRFTARSTAQPAARSPASAASKVATFAWVPVFACRHTSASSSPGAISCRTIRLGHQPASRARCPSAHRHQRADSDPPQRCDHTRLVPGAPRMSRTVLPSDRRQDDWRLDIRLGLAVAARTLWIEPLLPDAFGGSRW